MARESSTILDTGDRFPDLEFHLVSGGRMLFPRDSGSRWRVLLVYRGHW
jgi:hypothetical protein